MAAFLAASGIELVPFDGSHLEAARRALVRFGRGEPLLFTGDDFSDTDVEPASTH